MITMECTYHYYKLDPSYEIFYFRNLREVKDWIKSHMRIMSKRYLQTRYEDEVINGIKFTERYIDIRGSKRDPYLVYITVVSIRNEEGYLFVRDKEHMSKRIAMMLKEIISEIESFEELPLID